MNTYRESTPTCRCRASRKNESKSISLSSAIALLPGKLKERRIGFENCFQSPAGRPSCFSTIHCMFDLLVMFGVFVMFDIFVRFGTYVCIFVILDVLDIYTELQEKQGSSV